MRSPFPGMDPYIESRRLWEDFHHDLISEIKAALIAMLPEQYVVSAGERSYIECISPDREEYSSHRMLPDVSVVASTARVELSEGGTAIAVAEADPQAVEMHGLVEEEYREGYLEIRLLNAEERLVTGIEVLSPANKRSGSSGWYLYERKRAAFLQGLANFVEIDLLRGGRRMPMQEPWPDGPYYLLVMRKQEAPRCRVRPAHFHTALSPIRVPLLPPDSDLTLDLQPLIEAIYDRSRYNLRIDYHKPCQPPLPEADAVWLQDRLKSLTV